MRLFKLHDGTVIVVRHVVAVGQCDTGSETYNPETSWFVDTTNCTDNLSYITTEECGRRLISILETMPDY